MLYQFNSLYLLFTLILFLSLCGIAYLGDKDYKKKIRKIKYLIKESWKNLTKY